MSRKIVSKICCSTIIEGQDWVHAVLGAVVTVRVTEEIIVETWKCLLVESLVKGAGSLVVIVKKVQLLRKELCVLSSKRASFKSYDCGDWHLDSFKCSG